MKIIFLIDSTFSERDFERFGINIMFERSVEVLLWDLCKLRHNKIALDLLDLFEKETNKVKRHIFSSYEELEDHSIELQNAFLIDQRNGIYRKFTTCWFQDKGATVIFLDQGLTPPSIFKPSILDYLRILQYKFLKNGAKKTLFDIIKLIKKYSPIKSDQEVCHDIKVCSGSVSVCSNGEYEIRSHSRDYDIYLKEKNKEKSADNYAVFLENGMVNHPDYYLLGKSSYITHNEYLLLMNSFFDYVEKKTKLTLVIAAHPKIKDLDSMSVDYGGRKVLSGKSAELVRGAKLVLAHDSTAISFAALWSIPLLIVTTNQIEKSIYLSMTALSKILKTTRLNLDFPYNDVNLTKLAQKPIAEYDEYIDKLIKTKESPIEDSTTILINHLEKYVK